MTETPKLTPFRTADMEKWHERYKGNLQRTSTAARSYIQVTLNPQHASLCIENNYADQGEKCKRLLLCVFPESHPEAYVLLVGEVNAEHPLPPFMLLDKLIEVLPEVAEYFAKVGYAEVTP
jgi:hypothetical protein